MVGFFFSEISVSTLPPGTTCLTLRVTLVFSPVRVLGECRNISSMYFERHLSEQKCTASQSSARLLSHTEAMVTSRLLAVMPIFCSAKPKIHLWFARFCAPQVSHSKI